MSDRTRFDALRRELARISERDDIPLSVLIAAFAFELDVLLSAAPDAFWVTPIADLANVTDAEADAENAWNDALASLFRMYLRP